jgi:hypothetical protein
MDEIARMFMTSRPLLWAWIDGSAAPDAADVKRIVEIRDLLSEHFGDDLRTAFRVWRSQARSGASLRGLFCAAFIDRAAVSAQVNLLGSSIRTLRSSQSRRETRPYEKTGRNGAIDDAPTVTFQRD